MEKKYVVRNNLCNIAGYYVRTDDSFDSFNCWTRNKKDAEKLTAMEAIGLIDALYCKGIQDLDGTWSICPFRGGNMNKIVFSRLIDPYGLKIKSKFDGKRIVEVVTNERILDCDTKLDAHLVATWLYFNTTIKQVRFARSQKDYFLNELIDQKDPISKKWYLYFYRN